MASFFWFRTLEFPHKTGDGKQEDDLAFLLLAGLISPFLQLLAIVTLAIGSVEENLALQEGSGG
jgi:hypothetical protein